MQITTIGLDIAKNVFRGSRDRGQGEGGCEEATPAQPGDYVFQGIAAVPDRHGSLCHGALLGARADEARPEVRLMPAKDVKAYVKRNKNDTADAEAICKAVRRPTMRLVQIESAEQQGQLMQHRTRDV